MSASMCPPLRLSSGTGGIRGPPSVQSPAPPPLEPDKHVSQGAIRVLQMKWPFWHPNPHPPPPPGWFGGADLPVGDGTRGPDQGEFGFPLGFPPPSRSLCRKAVARSAARVRQPRDGAAVPPPPPPPTAPHRRKVLTSCARGPNDPPTAPLVTDFVPPRPRAVPVGRLDLESEGLLLLTNDGSFARMVTSPEFGVRKSYRVLVEGLRHPWRMQEVWRSWGTARHRGPFRVRGGQGYNRREGTSEAAPEAVRQATGEGCRSGWGRLLSVTNSIEAGTWRQGDSGWAMAGRGGGGPPPPFQRIPGGVGPLCTVLGRSMAVLP